MRDEERLRRAVGGDAEIVVGRRQDDVSVRVDGPDGRLRLRGEGGAEGDGIEHDATGDVGRESRISRGADVDRRHVAGGVHESNLGLGAVRGRRLGQRDDLLGVVARADARDRDDEIGADVDRDRFGESGRCARRAGGDGLDVDLPDRHGERRAHVRVRVAVRAILAAVAEDRANVRRAAQAHAEVRVRVLRNEVRETDAAVADGRESATARERIQLAVLDAGDELTAPEREQEKSEGGVCPPTATHD